MTIKLRSLLEENNILVPRNIDSRIENKRKIDLKRIQEYIKNGSQGDLNLSNAILTKLPDNLTRVGGTLFINASYIEDLNNIEYVGEDLWADGSRLKSLSKLTRVGNDMSLADCPIDNIDNLEYVGGGLWIDGTDISELPEGLEVVEGIILENTPLGKRFPDEASFERYLEERNINA